jgi:hypothetical protein
MIRSSSLLLLLPLGVLLGQRPKQVVDLSSEGVFQIVDTTDLHARPINAPIIVVISAPNQASFQVIPARDSGRGPMFGRGRLEYAAEMGDVLLVTSQDTLSLVHVEATQNGRVIASGEGVYVVVHREATGVAIESRNQMPPSVTPHMRKL